MSKAPNAPLPLSERQMSGTLGWAMGSGNVPKQDPCRSFSTVSKRLTNCANRWVKGCEVSYRPDVLIQGAAAQRLFCFVQRAMLNWLNPSGTFAPGVKTRSQTHFGVAISPSSQSQICKNDCRLVVFFFQGSSCWFTPAAPPLFLAACIFGVARAHLANVPMPGAPGWALRTEQG